MCGRLNIYDSERIDAYLQAHTWPTSDDKEELYALMAPTTLPLVIYECDPKVDNARNNEVQCMAARA